MKENENDFVGFINFLVENFNDNLYHSPEYQNDGYTIEKSFTPIRIEKIDYYTFKLIL